MSVLIPAGQPLLDVVPGLDKMCIRDRAVGCPGRVIQRQPVKEGSKLFFCVLGEHLVDSGQVALLRTAGGVQIHIEDQALEQVGLTIIPEVVALSISFGVGDDDICLLYTSLHLCFTSGPKYIT